MVAGFGCRYSGRLAIMIPDLGRGQSLMACLCETDRGLVAMSTIMEMQLEANWDYIGLL